MWGRSRWPGPAAGQISEIPPVFISICCSLRLTLCPRGSCRARGGGGGPAGPSPGLATSLPSPAARLTSAARTESPDAESPSCDRKGPLLTGRMRARGFGKVWKAGRAATSEQNSRYRSNETELSGRQKRLPSCKTQRFLPGERWCRGFFWYRIWITAAVVREQETAYHRYAAY